MQLNFIPIRIFRETPQVAFFDASIKTANGADVVINHNNAVSPPNDDKFEQYYIHHHQIDHNLVIEGNRTFTLINPTLDELHHVIFLILKWGLFKYLLELITDHNQDKIEALF